MFIQCHATNNIDLCDVILYLFNIEKLWRTLISLYLIYKSVHSQLILTCLSQWTNYYYNKNTLIFMCNFANFTCLVQSDTTPPTQDGNQWCKKGIITVQSCQFVVILLPEKCLPASGPTLWYCAHKLKTFSGENQTVSSLAPKVCLGFVHHSLHPPSIKHLKKTYYLSHLLGWWL